MVHCFSPAAVKRPGFFCIFAIAFSKIIVTFAVHNHRKQITIPAGCCETPGGFLNLYLHLSKTFPTFAVHNRKRKQMTAGGKRNGAGKPHIPEELKRKNTTLRLSQDSIRRLAVIRAAGFQTSRVVDDLLEAFCRHANLEDTGVEDSPIS